MSDIVLYYTGALTPKQDQPKSFSSTGGFATVRAVPNARSGNLFDSISELASSKKKRKTLGLIAENTSGRTISEMELWFVYGDSSITTLSAAVVLVGYDINNNPYIEKLESPESLPFDADFHGATEASPLVVSVVIQKGRHFGLIEL